MKISKNALGILMLSLVFVLSACGNNNSTKESTHDNHSDSSSHEEMDHSGSADVPEGLQESKNPKYKVGVPSNHQYFSYERHERCRSYGNRRL